MSRTVQRALLSVWDKTGIVDLASELHERKVELLSTGGTYRTLVEAGLPVTEVAHFTGFPEMMDGRVKTLHPKIHGGLLARRDSGEHMAQAERHAIDLIDLVVVNLYPFEATCAKEGVTTAEKIEQIDIGGPSMLRSAAKNCDAVCVVCDVADYPRLVDEMKSHDGGTSLEFRRMCARKVFRTTGRYDALIADELWRDAVDNGEQVADEVLPEQMAIPLKRVQQLRYGENPHQQAAFYETRLPQHSGVAVARQLNGKELSYNNLMDADGAWELVKEFSGTACSVIKHANPCGCALADDQETAFRRAWDGDPQAAFGSIIAFNQALTVETAAALCEEGRFVEAIIAPSFAPEALEMLTTVPKWKKNVRLLAAGEPTAVPAGGRYVKNILGGLLVQGYDTVGWDASALNVVTKREPSSDELRDLEVAWLVVKHLKSNAISLVKDGALVGPGTGQMSRVNSAQFAAQLAGDRAQGSVLGSDAFFPFPDGVEAAAAAGVKAIVQPGGSKGDPAVIEAADAHGIAMVFTGVRHFRH